MANPNPDTSGLRPWKKGQSGNPKGRPPGASLSEKLKRFVNELDEGKVADQLVAAGVQAALDGDFRFWNAILERLDGKVADKIEGENGPLEIIVKHVKQQPPETDADD